MIYEPRVEVAEDLLHQLPDPAVRQDLGGVAGLDNSLVGHQALPPFEATFSNSASSLPSALTISCLCSGRPQARRTAGSFQRSLRRYRRSMLFLRSAMSLRTYVTSPSSLRDS